MTEFNPFLLVYLFASIGGFFIGLVAYISRHNPAPK